MQITPNKLQITVVHQSSVGLSNQIVPFPRSDLALGDFR